jgi:nucleoside-diphosphate-sugar epimerase
MAGADDRLINHVHRDDVVSALLLLTARRAELRGETFNVVGDSPISRADAYQWLQARLGRPSDSLAGDRAGEGALPGREKRKRAETNKHVSNRKLRSLGWEPRYPTFQSAMNGNVLSSFGF